ncbi:MAG: GIY-YIG nuclease family protein [Hyphomonadaceae bacterium]|jgi:hypothetical protein|nr:GIY-YIG nuclease family protein [Hyphomonadaceae bacterium]
MSDRRPVLPPSLPPRGLSRVQAAEYIGVPPFVLDQMVERETMPPPKEIGVWDRHQLQPIARFADVPEHEPSGFVYFFTWKTGRFVKIGYAKKLATRLHDLQVAVPWKLIVYAALRGAKDDERLIHRILNAYHYRGEWFHFVPEVRQLVLCMKQHEDVLGDYLRDVTDEA